ASSRKVRGLALYVRLSSILQGIRCEARLVTRPDLGSESANISPFRDHHPVTPARALRIYAQAMPDSTPLAAAHPLPLLREDAWRGAEPPSLAGPVCFGRRQFASHEGEPPRLRLRPAHAEALAELLPVLLCGEESAALAFDQIAGSGDLQREMRAALARIPLHALEHQPLLHPLPPALPPPHP